MKITEIIVQLDQLYKKHGDLEFCLMTEQDEFFAFDFTPQLEVIEIESEDMKKWNNVLCVVPSTIHFDDDPTPHLKIVK